MVQQAFHLSLFLSRTSDTTSTNRQRSNSLSSIPQHKDIIDLTSIQNHQSLTHSENSTHVDAQEGNWTEVNNKKRQRSSPDISSRCKQSKLNSYWLSQKIETSNRFSELEVEQETIVKELAREPRPPPIFVDRVSNIQPLINLLDKHVNGKYTIKVLQNDRVKIQPHTTETYPETVKLLKDKDTEFYTYKPKGERSFKVILKNMHPSMDTNDIKTQLNEQGHIVTNIWNIKQRSTKKPLPIFIIELKPQTNNKLIYDIKRLLNCNIYFEPPRPKREIPQCSNCQQYGHTKKYCHRKPKCIKCAGDHSSSTCEKKGRLSDVKCVLCDGNHPANYKGCNVYRELQKIKYPSPRERRPARLSPKDETIPKQNITPGNTLKTTFAQGSK